MRGRPAPAPTNDDSDDDEVTFGFQDNQVTFSGGQFQPAQPSSSTLDADDTLPDADYLNDTLPFSTTDDSVDDAAARSYTIPDQLRSILPANWNPGEDGLGKYVGKFLFDFVF